MTTITITQKVKRKTRTLGRFTHTDIAGTNRVVFTGRLAGHTLKPGTYTLTLQARNAAGTSSTLKITFKIKRAA